MPAEENRGGGHRLWGSLRIFVKIQYLYDNSHHFSFFNSYFIVLLVDLTEDYSKKMSSWLTVRRGWERMNSMCLCCASQSLIGLLTEQKERFLTWASSSTAVVIREAFAPPPNHFDACLNHFSCSSCSLSKTARYVCDHPDGRTFPLQWAISVTPTQALAMACLV